MKAKYNENSATGNQVSSTSAFAKIRYQSDIYIQLQKKSGKGVCLGASRNQSIQGKRSRMLARAYVRTL